MTRSEIMTRYAAGESATNLAKEVDYSASTIWNIAKKMNIKRPTKFRTCQHSINHFYFSEINSPQKAYWLGYLYADGCLLIDKQKRKYLALHLHSDDRILIETLLKDIESSHKISIDKRGYLQCRVSSQQLCDDLIKWGVVQRKTHADIKIPDIEFKDSFIRGFLDGDGCIYKDSISFCCHGKQFLMDIKKEINNFYCQDFGSISRAQNSWQLAFGGKTKSIMVYNYLYQNVGGDFFLERKAKKVCNFSLAQEATQDMKNRYLICQSNASKEEDQCPQQTCEGKDFLK